MFLYRLILTLLAPPALVLRQLVLALRGRAEPGGIAQRLALSVPRANGPVLWLHAASNGELASARGAVATILGRHPDLGVVVTTNTLTGRALAESWALPRLTARLAPADTPGAVRRFLDALRPVALVVVENELWPERLARCASRGIPVLVLGARMSAGSSRNWARFRKLAARVIGSLSWLSAQDADSARRFVALGLAETRLGPVISLKAAFAAARQASVLPFPRPDTVLAASTHPGEEAVVLAAFRAARAQNPALRLILAPRHPRRSAEIARLITGAGLAFATRSKGEAPDVREWEEPNLPGALGLGIDVHDPPTDPRTSTRKAALLEQRPYLSLQTSVNYVATRGAVPLMGIIVYLAGQRRPKTGKAALERP